ncbi:hypothetical protein BDR06DRAFT_949690 [Suillus hirtellus]|nr:hypothetical protein BDR06DRAFT_949690 [Suillus hirtellus]
MLLFQNGLFSAPMGLDCAILSYYIFPASLHPSVHAHFRGVRAHSSPSILPIDSLIEYEH